MSEFVVNGKLPVQNLVPWYHFVIFLVTNTKLLLEKFPVQSLVCGKHLYCFQKLPETVNSIDLVESLLLS
jgi:hypothetical protein